FAIWTYSSPLGGVERPDYPVGHLVRPFRHVDESHFCQAWTVCDPALLSLVTVAVPFRDTPAGSTPLLIALAPCVGLDEQVGWHASHSMRPRICPKRARVK